MERDGRKKMAMLEEKVKEDKGLEQDYDGEEEKIQKFYAIIKRLRGARSSTMDCLHEVEGSGKDAKKVRVHGPPVWTPVFELEDFAGLQKDNNASISIRCNMKKEIGKGKANEEEDKGLDLNLTL